MLSQIDVEDQRDDLSSEDEIDKWTPDALKPGNFI